MTEAGTYFAQVLYGDELLSTEQITIVMEDMPIEPKKYKSLQTIVGEPSHSASQPGEPKHDENEIQW